MSRCFSRSGTFFTPSPMTFSGPAVPGIGLGCADPVGASDMLLLSKSILEGSQDAGLVFPAPSVPGLAECHLKDFFCCRFHSNGQSGTTSFS